MRFIETLLSWCILLGVVIIRDTWALNVKPTIIVILVFLAVGATIHYLWTVYVEVKTASAILEAL